MCSCAHCANVCVALILVFPLTIPHLLPSFLSSLLMVTRPPPSQFHTKPYLFIFPLFLNSYLFLHSTCLVPHQLLTTFIHLSIHESIHSLIHHIWFPPPNFHHQPFSTFPLLLISGLSLFPFSSSLTLSTSFSSSIPPFLSLFHTVLCASLSLAGLLLGG